MQSQSPKADGADALRIGSRQTPAELRELQRLTASAVLRSLDGRRRMQRTWTDGRPMKEVAAEFIKPNDRLSSLERLEIYNRQYWFRVLDCLYDDFPGLRAVLGERKFHQLRVAYLTRYPSESFNLRDLGGRLERFLREEPHWTHPHEALSLDMARFEWAHIVAFDGEARPALTVDDLLGKDPAKLRLGVQPYLTLLEIRYPLDEFVIAVKRRPPRSEASNAVETPTERASARPRRPRPERTLVAVHRHNNSVYYKRLTPPQYRVLTRLRDGATIAKSCAALPGQTAPPGGWAPRVSAWFRQWMELGWFCKYSNGRRP